MYFSSLPLFNHMRHVRAELVVSIAVQMCDIYAYELVHLLVQTAIMYE